MKYWQRRSLAERVLGQFPTVASSDRRRVHQLPRWRLGVPLAPLRRVVIRTGGGYVVHISGRKPTWRVPIQASASWSNVRRADDPVWRVSSHVFGGALANYIQLDIIESCGRCVSLVIRSSACETSQRARGMMRVINSTKFSEATSPTTSSRCPPSARVSRRFAFRTQAAPSA